MVDPALFKLLLPESVLELVRRQLESPSPFGMEAWPRTGDWPRQDSTLDPRSMDPWRELPVEARPRPRGTGGGAVTPELGDGGTGHVPNSPKAPPRAWPSTGDLACFASTGVETGVAGGPPSKPAPPVE